MPNTFVLQDDPDFILLRSRFPHIAKKLEIVWSDPDFGLVINGLLNDTRGGTRQGFPVDIASAMFRLLNTHNDMYPPKPNPDRWAQYS